MEADKVRLGKDHYLYFDAVPHPGIFRCSVIAQNPITERVTAFDAVVPYSWTVENDSLYYMDSLTGIRTIHRYDLASGQSDTISGPIASAAHEASMTVFSAKHQIIYSQYDESSSYIRAVRADAFPR